MLTLSNSPTEGPRILGATVQIVVARNPCTLDPLVKFRALIEDLAVIHLNNKFPGYEGKSTLEFETVFFQNILPFRLNELYQN